MEGSSQEPNGRHLHHHHPHSQDDGPEWFAKYLNHQGDWLEKTRGNLMVAATVIASMSFQVMVNPPGGVWQDDKCNGGGGGDQTGGLFTGRRNGVCTRIAGTSVLEYGSKRTAYLGVVISSTVSFAASMSIILLVISGLRLRNRMIMGILILFMLAAVICMVGAFFFAVALVQSDDAFIRYVLLVYLGFWVVFPLLILVIQLIRFLIWLICLICCCKRRRRPRQPPRMRALSPFSDQPRPSP
ncbi:PREDICTED: uncharacterized protein LOC104815630 [Tarenaya hassleriana]|uniref:uncharacterized protein LOC104815630 n=1 Tax=Tarenaya hassleriana TaxID=28532 RepID=UPI00053C6A66|nr:PREDICTED: uncharacterized protein LOC104815630 [Tarenaya hassleriana]